jgi:hypothetical protein
MKKLFLCFLLTACGKEAYVGTRDTEQNPAQTNSQVQCVPLNQQSVMYRGVQCMRRHGEGDCYNYQCINGAWIRMNCRGEVY